MKKSTLMKLALLVVAMFIFAGINAQILTNYAETQITQPISYQTAGKDFRLYVLPDPVYSVGYVALANAPLGATQRWTWTYAGLTGAPLNGAATAQNWVTFTNPGVASYPIGVVESTTSGCTGAVITQTVNVVAAPSASIAGGSAANTWSTVTPSFEFSKCNAALSEDLTTTFVETGVPAGLCSYAYSITKEVTGYSAAMGIVVGPTVSTLINYPLAGKRVIATANGGTGTTATGAMPFVDFPAGTNVRTKYVFTIKSYTGGLTDGVVSAISHKSDFYPGGTTIYLFTGTSFTVTYWINLPPVTGPIYHISNTYAY